MDVRQLGQQAVVGSAVADVALARERIRQRRLLIISLVLIVFGAWLWIEFFRGTRFSMPTLPENVWRFLPIYLIVVIIGAVMIIPLAVAGRSPHVLYRPSEIPIGFADVVGIDLVLEEVVRSLNLFLGHRTFREAMGGTPRRAILFEGPPGTGKTHMAKAMAREAGVPFLFVSASAFQSMYYGQTNRKVRSFFKALRKAARREGGAIGFIEEFDAIATARGGVQASGLGLPDPQDTAHGRVVARTGVTEGVAGVVNELLVQLQSFERPTAGQRMRGALVDRLNRYLSPDRQWRKPQPKAANILVVGATNRAEALDPALLRPGRFDRTIHFGLPSRTGRRELIDYYLDRKAHAPELNTDEARNTLAAMTFGYSPVMIEHICDEALVWALRDGRTAMDWHDVQQAKLTEEIGLKQPVEYTEAERRAIATHEAGHAVVAYLEGKGRKLEVLSIVKRRDALGLLAHSEVEERFTQTRDEIEVLVKISLGGMVAEELYFGQSGTGPRNDLAAATRLAAQMVGALGMAGSLTSFDAVEPGPFAQGIVGKVLANSQAKDAVDGLLARCRDDVVALLGRNRHLVDALRDELLTREELVGEEIVAVLARAVESPAGVNPTGG